MKYLWFPFFPLLVICDVLFSPVKVTIKQSIKDCWKVMLK